MQTLSAARTLLRQQQISSRGNPDCAAQHAVNDYRNWLLENLSSPNAAAAPTEGIYCA
jgi:hypothetical protein